MALFLDVHKKWSTKRRAASNVFQSKRIEKQLESHYFDVCADTPPLLRDCEELGRGVICVFNQQTKKWKVEIQVGESIKYTAEHSLLLKAIKLVDLQWQRRKNLILNRTQKVDHNWKYNLWSALSFEKEQKV